MNPQDTTGMRVEWRAAREVIRDASPTRSLCGSRRLFYVIESDLAERQQRALTIVNFALGERRDVDLRSPPSFCAEAIVHRRDSKR